MGAHSDTVRTFTSYRKAHSRPKATAETAGKGDIVLVFGQDKPLAL